MLFARPAEQARPGTHSAILRLGGEGRHSQPAPNFWPKFWKEECGERNPKTRVVVEVVQVVPVTESATGVPTIIVEGTAAQHPVVVNASLAVAAHRNTLLR
ncbi:MAG: hypothetical protein L0Z70_07570, partial [Chloroflexi bacterium]|nr:hypothetical protein [Chloroflexota bacterium]